MGYLQLDNSNIKNSNYSNHQDFSFFEEKRENFGLINLIEIAEYFGYLILDYFGALKKLNALYIDYLNLLFCLFHLHIFDSININFDYIIIIKMNSLLHCLVI